MYMKKNKNMRKNRLQSMLGGTKITNILYIIFVSFWIWMSITSTIQGFKCDSMTRTQLFKRIPQSFVCNWIECDNKYKN